MLVRGSGFPTLVAFNQHDCRLHCSTMIVVGAVLVDQHTALIGGQVLNQFAGDIKQLSRRCCLPCPGVLNLESLQAQLGYFSDGNQFAGG